MKTKFNLQLFAEGGAGAGASTGDAGANGGTAEAGVEGASPAAQSGEDLSNVIYGKSQQELTQPEQEPTTQAPEDKAKLFREMVKKGGEYHDEFSKISQDMINKRFKASKALEEQLQKTNGIMSTLAAKYGVDPSDIEGLSKAIEADDSLYQEQAYKEGLSVEQYREKLSLQRELANLKAAEEEQKRQQRSDEIYANWLSESQSMVQKYGIQNFDLAEEMRNENFTNLLAAGVDFESAYKSIHFDDMLNGAMAQTASNVEQAVVNKIASRAQRPAENGTQSSTSTEVFKPDPNKWSDRDIDEVIRKVHRGEQIYL